MNNSIVYGNVATGEDVWILKAQIGEGFDAFFSCVEGLLQTEPGEDAPNPANFPGCIDTDPRVDASNTQWALMENSPCIDAGKNAYYQATWPSEGLGGANRFTDHPDVPDTGIGTAPIIDMGASENAGNGGCDPNDIAQPTGLNVSFNANQFALSWTPIPGTGSCRIQGGTSPANAQSFVVSGDAPSSKSFPTTVLNAGQNYGWRVRCACTSDPAAQGPWSSIQYFSLPSAKGFIETSRSAETDAFQVFPNPGHEIYKVQVSASEAGLITVRNALGQAVWQRKFSSENAAHDLEINGPSGLYFFQLTDAKGQVIQTKKVIKL